MTVPDSVDFSTCDLCDAHKGSEPGVLRVLSPVFKNYGGLSKFSGQVVTVKCFEDNTSVKLAVDLPGNGCVLVVDGGASLRYALLGGNLGATAALNGWAGVVINGCVRDLAELSGCHVGIRALGAIPLPTQKRSEGQTGIAIQIQGQWIKPGEWLYADEDGMVVLPAPLVA